MIPTRVILNPRAGGGRALRRWPVIEAQLRARIGAFDAAISAAPGDVAARVGNAVREKVRRVIVAGGDGTVHEAANGLMASSAPDSTVLGFIPIGTGCDFARTFGIAGESAAIDRVAAGRERRIDVGRLWRPGTGPSGGAEFFVNVASAGVSGEIVAAVNRGVGLRFLGAGAAFFLTSVRELMRCRFPRVRIRIDDAFDETVKLAVLAVANGRAFGGGMQIAPDATPDDGLFDVVIVRGDSRLALLRNLRLLYAGAHVGYPLVTIVRGTRVVVEPIDAICGALVECDGEPAGEVPAQFAVIPGAIRLLA